MQLVPLHDGQHGRHGGFDEDDARADEQDERPRDAGDGEVLEGGQVADHEHDAAGAPVPRHARRGQHGGAVQLLNPVDTHSLKAPGFNTWNPPLPAATCKGCPSSPAPGRACAPSNNKVIR
jgi:hypothetical protein